MALSPDMKNAMFAVGGTVGGGVIVAAILAIPGKWKSWKKEIADEALHRDAEMKLSLEVGAQKQRIDDWESDLQGVADMVREQFKKLNERLEKRFARLEKKDAVIETMLTGEIPKFEGDSTGERPSGEQVVVSNA